MSADKVLTAAEPISVRIPEAVRLTGLSRSRIYELMKSGDIEFAKVGSSTLVWSKACVSSFLDGACRPCEFLVSCLGRKLKRPIPITRFLTADAEGARAAPFRLPKSRQEERDRHSPQKDEEYDQPFGRKVFHCQIVDE